MFYITVPATPHEKQISIDEFLNFDFTFEKIVRRDIPYSRTCKKSEIPWSLKSKTHVNSMISALERIVDMTSGFDLNHMEKYYRHYEIPKKSGGKRPIDEPLPELKDNLKALRHCLEYDCGARWHTSAYAYIPGRGTKDERLYHANRGSRWFEYLDFHNFFGSFTYEYAWETISHIYPFCMIVEKPNGKTALEHCLKLCFLNGGLPQGTPISPMLTNLLMIPFDFEISRKLAHDFEDKKLYYTRYADDICVSCSKDFDPKEIEKMVLSLLKDCGAPFVLNTKKTHYCSFAGHNFHLGLMYNANHEVTIGWRKKDEIKAMLTNWALDTKNGVERPIHDAQVVLGQFNYFRQQEKEYADYVISHLSEKYGIDIEHALLEKIKEVG